MLNTERNTARMQARVLKSARANLRKRKLSTFFEHGQWWVEHRTTGAQWSVCDAEGLGIIGGFCFEQVTRGEMSDCIHRNVYRQEADSH